jgi:ribosomal protein L23
MFSISLIGYLFIKKKTILCDTYFTHDNESMNYEDVNVINTHGKVKRFKGRIGKRSDVKKAIVSIKNGQEINFAKLG